LKRLPLMLTVIKASDTYAMPIGSWTLPFTSDGQ
jgi:hypothetical protein